MNTKTFSGTMMTLLLVCLLALTIRVQPAKAADSFVPIVDGDAIPFGYPVSIPPSTWDSNNPNLVVERGDGFVEVGLPATDMGATLGIIWCKITFAEATVLSVKDFDGDGNLITPNGGVTLWDCRYGCEYCNDGGQDRSNSWPNYVSGSRDEIDWGSDLVEFWLGTTSARDCFRINLDYSETVAASMIITYMDGTYYNSTKYAYGQDEGYFSYGASVPLTESTLVEVIIDIKPASDPNSFSEKDQGVLPVAMLGSIDFDVTTVDPSTVMMDSATAMERGKSGKIAAYEDVNGDGYIDAMFRFEVQELMLSPGIHTLILTGNLQDGTPIEGTDEVRVV